MKKKKAVMRREEADWQMGGGEVKGDPRKTCVAQKLSCQKFRAKKGVGKEGGWPGRSHSECAI